jgi:hypothetical protein
VVDPNCTNKLTWIEDSQGQPIAVRSYLPEIEEKDQAAFDKVNWKELPLQRTKLLGAKNNDPLVRFKANQVIYHMEERCYVKLVKLIEKK